MAKEAQNEKSPSQVVENDLQQSHVLSDVKMFLTQASNRPKTSTRGDLRNLLLTGQELLQKLDERLISINYELAQLDK